ncbi:MAG: DUF1810 family protein [Comamonadaceae bacterium]|nr:MAG: DUF1810 family protein [Comamonadaceae bacterium]
MDADPFKLQRFVDAQAGVYPAVCAELAAGRKTSHWMWFIFPQLAALGRSETARFYGLADAAHARAYWTHPTLGARLDECSRLVLAIDGRSAHDIFGSPDDLKLCSSMTLFRGIDVALGHMHAEAVGDEHGADHQEKAQRQHHHGRIAVDEVGQRFGRQEHDRDGHDDRDHHHRQVVGHADGRQDGVDREHHVEQHDLHQH